MTSKLSWIFFIPLTIAAVFFKLAQLLMPEGSIFGLSNTALDYVSVACVALIFITALVLCITDRKISPYYLPHRNIPAGIIGLLLAVVCAADGANRIYLMLSSGKVEALEIVESALLLLASVVFIVMGLTHSFVNRDNKNFALFNVMPALLCAIRLVRCFIGITTISITQADITLLVCYVFATLFFFNFAVTISLTEAKHAVKSCFIFGFPAAGMLLARGIWGAAEGFDTSAIFSNAGMIELLLMGVYIFAFLLELTIFIKDKDHIVISDGSEAEQPIEEDDLPEDQLVVTGAENQNYDAESSYLNTTDAEDVEDYLYQAVDQNNESSYFSGDADDSGYITNVVEDPNADSSAKASRKGANDTPYGSGYSTRLDEIDKLIIELTGGYDE